MSLLAASALRAPTSCISSDISRRYANFHPDIWGDTFIQYISGSAEADIKMEDRMIMLKENVRKMLITVDNDDEALKSLMEKAKLIDLLQRLGLYYHFDHEIDEVLQHIHNNCVDNNGIITPNEDLYSVALIFRLLRQKGHHISPDVFYKFKDEQGNFDEKLITKDVEGMLSLYEAANLSIHGEEILDEALAFTSKHLELIITQLNPFLAAKVNHSLKRPLRKNIPRLEARYFISTYEEDPSHDETILLFAKLDFNMLQRQHQKEVGNLSKWWKDLDFATKLPFARNRIVEAYFWSLGVYFEPQYSLGRKLVTKVVAIATLIDDIYDVYGTFEELQLFTEAIERWDISCMQFLPEYAKHCYQALLGIYEEAEQELTKEGRAFCVIHAKNEMKRLVQAYFAEAKWLNRNYTPTVEEYLGVALVSCGYGMVTATSFIGMGCITTEKTFQWLLNNPKTFRASTIICRLMDDIASHEFEQKREHAASAIECYMKQHGARKQEAINEFHGRVISAWKDINGECLNPTEVPMSILMLVLNLTRVMDVLYKEGDCYTHSKGSTKDNIVALLVNPISV